MAMDPILPGNTWLGPRELILAAALGIAARLTLQCGRLTYRDTPPLDSYQLAYLAGGGKRVVYAALAALRVRGSLGAAGPPGRALEVLAPPEPQAPPIEQEVYRAVRDGRSPDSLTRPDQEPAALEPIAESVAGLGLALRPRRRLLAFACSALGGVAALLLASGVGLLVFLLAFTGVSHRSFAGRRAVARQRAVTPRDANWTGGTPAQGARVIALYGLDALSLGDRPLADALDTFPGTRSPTKISG